MQSIIFNNQNILYISMTSKIYEACYIESTTDSGIHVCNDSYSCEDMSQTQLHHQYNTGDGYLLHPSTPQHFLMWATMAHIIHAVLTININ